MGIISGSAESKMRFLTLTKIKLDQFVESNRYLRLLPVIILTIASLYIAFNLVFFNSKSYTPTTTTTPAPTTENKSDAAEEFYDVPSTVVPKPVIDQGPIILFWPSRKPGYDSVWDSFNSSDEFQYGCIFPPEISSCRWTRDTEKLSEASAVVLYWPTVRKDMEFPLHVNNDQVFVYFNDESPLVARMPKVETLPVNYFNRTMAYRIGSDHPVTWNTFEAPILKEEYDMDFLQWKVESNLVAMFLSNCSDVSAKRIVPCRLVIKFSRNTPAASPTPSNSKPTSAPTACTSTATANPTSAKTKTNAPASSAPTTFPSHSSTITATTTYPSPSTAHSTTTSCPSSTTNSSTMKISRQNPPTSPLTASPPKPRSATLSRNWRPTKPIITTT